MIYLCSCSPRRRELMNLITKNFRIKEPNFNETFSEYDSPVEYVIRNAEGKAKSVRDEISGEDADVFLGADTIVTIDSRILCKPKNNCEAKEQLMYLSGNMHTVVTGVTLLCGDMEISAHSETKVYFNTLSEREIDEYILTKEPLDKAGSYGIQGFGSRFVEKIEGCYFNVVGLPVSLVYNMLKENNLSGCS